MQTSFIVPLDERRPVLGVTLVVGDADRHAPRLDTYRRCPPAESHVLTAALATTRHDIMREERSWIVRHRLAHLEEGGPTYEGEPHPTGPDTLELSREFFHCVGASVRVRMIKPRRSKHTVVPREVQTGEDLVFGVCEVEQGIYVARLKLDIGVDEQEPVSFCLGE